MFGKGEKEAESGPAQPARGFGKSDKDTPARGAGKASGEASAISADLKVVGNLESAGDIQVDGTVVGDINSRSLTVGEGAHVKGSITAEKVRICGKLSGQVTAASVSIAATAVMNGDITYQMLSIEEGASFDGRCHKADSTGTSVAGRIEAPVVFIESTARIVGSVFHTEIEIEEGALIEGRRPWRPKVYLEERSANRGVERDAGDA